MRRVDAIGEARVRVAKRGVADDAEELHLLSCGDVEHDFHLRITEADGAVHVGIDLAYQPVDVALPKRDEPGTAMLRSDGPFEDARRGRAADGGAQSRAVAAALARVELERRSEPVAVRSRVWTCEQRGAAENVCIDHRNRSAVVRTSDRMHQQRRRRPVQDNTDVPKR